MIFNLAALQRSLISYKSKMVMRSIPELLDDSSSHTSIAVPRHFREGSPPLTSSSDSDEDIDELPFIPMPLTMDFSGSRMSLNDILGDDDVTSGNNGTTEGEGLTGQGTVPMETGPADKAKEGGEPSILRGRLRKRATQEEDKGSSDEEPAVTIKRSEQSKRPLRRGSSMESEKTEGSSSGRKGYLRRGGSADSALLLHIKHGDGEPEGAAEDGTKKLKKAVSMELPRRSSSPGAGKLSKEDYALKLELMRQRLLRGVAVDNKMSGLRGPLLETLGVGDEKRTIPIERYVRPHRLGGAPMIRAASSDTAREDSPKIKVLRKSASFSQGDTEPIPLHRRSGAPLEIPMAQIEERRLQEAASMSALTDFKMDSHPVTPMQVSSEPPATEQMETIQESDAGEQIETVEEKIEPEKEVFENGSKESNLEGNTSAPGCLEKEVSMSMDETRKSENGSQNELVSEVAPCSVIEESTTKEEKNEEYVDELRTQKIAPEINIVTSAITVTPLTVPAKPSPNVIPTYVTPPPLTRVTLPDGRTSAYASTIQTIMVPTLQPASVMTTTPVPITTATCTPIPPSPMPEPAPTSQHPAVFSRVASTDNVSKEPSPPNFPVHPSSLTSEIKDIASEEVFESRFKKRDSSLTRGFKLLNWAKSEEKSATMPPESGENIYRPGAVGTPIQVVKPEASRMMLEKSKSVQDLREASKDRGFMKRLSMRLKRTPPTERKEEKSREEAPATESSGPRRRLSWALSRSKSQEKVAADVEMVRMDGAPEAPKEEVVMEPKKASESPIMNMRRKIESTVAGISMRIRSQSEERKGQEDRKEEKKAEEKCETKRTPLLSLLRRSSSEGISLKKLGLTQNPLASQSVSTASTESLESTSSIQSESAIKSKHLNLFLCTSLKYTLELKCLNMRQ